MKGVTALRNVVLSQNAQAPAFVENSVLERCRLSRACLQGRSRGLAVTTADVFIHINAKVGFLSMRVKNFEEAQ